MKQMKKKHYLMNYKLYFYKHVRLNIFNMIIKNI